MEDIIIIVLLLIIIGGIALYLWHEKKSGIKCIGCPCAKQCTGKCNGGCGHSNTGKCH